jgi:hypothetical protein
LKGCFAVHWLPGAPSAASGLAVVFVLAPEAERFATPSAPIIVKAAKTTATCFILLMTCVSSRNDWRNPPVASFAREPGVPGPPVLI